MSSNKPNSSRLGKDGMDSSKKYGRLGDRAQVMRVWGMVRNAGGSIVEDKDAGVVIGYIDGDECFRALDRGADWLFIYDKRYFPKPN